MRSILCFLLALVAAPAWAAWVEVGENDALTAYIDPATIRKTGDLRRVWIILNLKQRHKDGEMSRRRLDEYDCKQERYRTVSLSEHSEPMAGGRTLITSNSPSEWRYIPPDTVAEDVLKSVCAK